MTLTAVENPVRVRDRAWFGFQNPAWLYVAVFLAAFLLYARTLGFGLSYFDDIVWVGNDAWGVKDWNDVLALFSQRDPFSPIYYRPLLILSCKANILIARQMMWPYHLPNVIIHAVNGCLVLALARRLGFSKALAFLLSLVFLSHPTLVQAVSWIPGRVESLVAVFVFASFLLFLDCLKSHRPGSYLWHHLFLLAALLSKEVAVVLPVLCWLYACLVARRKVFHSENLFFILGWSLIFAVWLWMRLHALHGGPGLGSADSLFQKFMVNAPAVLTYFSKAVLPVKLTVLPGLEKWMGFTRILALAGLVGIVFFVGKERRRLAWFGLIWFLLFLLPGLIVADFFFEYRLYLPLLGVILVLGAVLPVRLLEQRRLWFWVASVVVVGALVMMSLKYMSSFRDRFSFWEETVRGNPGSAFAHTSLGAVYHMEGNISKAMSHYDKALESNPREPILHNNLGYILASRGDYAGALKEYAQEIANNPQYVTVYYNLAELYVLMKEYSLAEQVWERSLELIPQNPRAVLGLVRLYLTTGQEQKAEAMAARLRY